MDSLKDAMEYIKGYCEKHKCCNTCRLYRTEDNATKGLVGCVLQFEEPPCDWEVPEE